METGVGIENYTTEYQTDDRMMTTKEKEPMENPLNNEFDRLNTFKVMNQLNAKKQKKEEEMQRKLEELQELNDLNEMYDNLHMSVSKFTFLYLFK